MKRRTRDGRRRVGTSAAMALSAAIVLAACGSDAKENSSSTTSAVPAASTAPSTGSTDTAATGDTAVTDGSTAASTPPSNGGIPGADEDLPAITLGYDSVYLVHPGAQTWKAGMECAVEAHGGKVIALDANLNVNQELSNIDQFIAQKVDAIASFPLDPTVVEGAFDKARAAGIPIIEVLNPDSTQDGKIWIDYTSMAQSIMQHIVDRFGTDAKVLYVDGGPTPDLVRQKKSALDAAEAAGLTNVTVVPLANPNTTVDNGEKTIGDALTKDPQIDAIVTTDDNLAIGGSLAADANGLDHTKMEIIGENLTNDGLQAVQDGVITATYGADQFAIGEQAGYMAELLKAGKTPSPYQVNSDRWDLSNVDSFVPYDKRCAQGG